MNGFLDMASALLLMLFIIKMFINLNSALIFGVLVKPIIDTSWDISLAGISLIEIFSVLFLIGCMMKFLPFRTKHYFEGGLSFLWLLAHIGLFSLLVINPFEAFRSVAKVLFFPVSLCFLPYYLNHKNIVLQKKLLRYLLLGSVFACGISVLQYLGLLQYEFLRYSKGLLRANGFYHDVVTGRIYMAQGLLSLAFIVYSNRFYIRKYVLYCLLFLFIFGGYTFFSKAAIVILLGGGLILLMVGGVGRLSIMLGFLLLGVLVINNAAIIENTNQLFIKEIRYQDGELDDANQILSGRGGLWADYLKTFEESGVVNRLFGLGINSGHTHNEFLRILILSGYVGLLCYILMMASIIAIGLKGFFRGHMRFIGLFVIFLLLVDSVGVVWGIYPNYLLVVLGFLIAAKAEGVTSSSNGYHAKLRIC